MVRKLLIALCAVTLIATITACEDALVIIGDLPGFMRIVAGVPDSIGTRTDSLALRTKLTHPSGLVVSNSGVMYFADQSARIFSVTSAGKLSVLASCSGCFEKNQLIRPQAIVFTRDSLGLLIVDDGSDRIWRLTLANRELVSIAGTGVNGIAADGTVATQANIASPAGIVVLPDGRILFAERNSNKVRVIGTDGVLRTFASSLNIPGGLAYANNILYIGELGSHTVRALDLATNTTRLIAGTGVAGYSGDTGVATEAALNYPWALAVSGSNLFIADAFNDRVRVVNLQSNIINTFTGTGSKLFTGNGRAAAETGINMPWALTLSSFGHLYIADYGHEVVWRTPVQAITQ